jgi:glycopeptide antibiotics resistance protein
VIPGVLPLPWLLPGIGVTCVVAVFASSRVGHWLGVNRTVAGGFILGLGMILAGTLTPTRSALDTGTTSAAVCDMTRMGPASLADILKFYDAGLNILLFIPFGATIALVPRSRRKAAIVLAAIAVPFAIEAIQLLVPALDRSCESADVVDNLTGLAIGLGGGFVAGRLMAAVDRRLH